MCFNNFRVGVRGFSEQKKLGLYLIQFRFFGNFFFQFIFVDVKFYLSIMVFVKIINFFVILSVGFYCYVDFIIGNYNWIQCCMVDFCVNVNCVGYDWINCFEFFEWNYVFECGFVKVVGGYIVDVEVCVFLKIFWFLEDLVFFVN